MHNFSRLALVLILINLLCGCSLYRANLRQGDFISQEELDRLHPNLTKYQVQEIMGAPALEPFFKQDQWNYTYAFVDGNHRDQPLKFKTISLFFKNGKLQSYSSRFWKPAHLPVQKN